MNSVDPASLKAVLNKVARLVRLPLPSGRDSQGRMPGDEPPLRAELFSVDQLKQHARALAGLHEVAPAPGSDHLLPRLRENERVLLDAYALVSTAAEHDRRVTPAAEWLLDNFYLIEEQVRMARRHLPRGYSLELPKLAAGRHQGFPRVYHLVLELISHVDGRLDIESLSGFVGAYQTATSLKLGELWAIPIMLRLALIENLRRMAARIATDRRNLDLADHWAGRLLAAGEQEPGGTILVLADMVRENLVLTSAFVIELSRRLHGQGPALVFPLTWLEQRLEEQGVTLEQLAAQENQRQAADQVSIGNTIGSLRFLGAMDWREFVETASNVEGTLRGDPLDVYNDMDFGTRDQYRHAVEKVARRSVLSEDQVAEKAIQLARERRAASEVGTLAAHVGYYLIDSGRSMLEQAVGMRPSLREGVRWAGRQWPLTFYLGGIFAITAGISAGILRHATGRGQPVWLLLLLAIPLLLASSQAAVTFLNWLSTILVRPRRLPRLDFSDGIPPECRTMVAVPTMLTTDEGMDRLLESLEVRYLANRDDHLHFALLTDYRDAPHESMPGDDRLLDRAREGVEALNIKYAKHRDDIFFLFHRPRRWSPQEGVWMGWERKRGKLTEFNSLLRGGSADRFEVIVGRIDVLHLIRYCLTLDTDTQLPRDAARELVGTIAHPLNRARFDPKAGRVISGYGVLQPRVGATLSSAGQSWYAWLFAADAGIDPYTRAVSDVYQDLFREGSFIGKGIYDVDVFEQACGRSFPENRILSHDLLEGAYARAGLVSDIMLFEDYPSRYPVDVSRRHRWIRGDWQIASWILPRVPGPRGRPLPNPISDLSRWKILDNLRRSLVAPALVVLLLAAWCLPGLAVAGTLFVMGILILPAILTTLHTLSSRPEELPWGFHLRAIAATAGRQLLQAAFSLVTLGYEAIVNVDAIIRTISRLSFTHRGLLQWQTASEAESYVRKSLAGACARMWTGPLLAAVAGLGLGLWRAPALTGAAGVLAMWWFSPVIAWAASLKRALREGRIRPEDRPFLGGVARRTWRFFETLVGSPDNWLPPDNFQEHPRPVVAHRTSPTNIGLSLLANLAAYDLGYICAGRLAERTTKTLQTLEKMERYRGHFYNWYDTRTLQPLPPRYVSSVDSGNLAGHLRTLAPGLDEIEHAPIIPSRMLDGFLDTIHVMAEITGARLAGGDPPPDPAPFREAVAQLESLRQLLAEKPCTLAHSYLLLQRVSTKTAGLVQTLAAIGDDELTGWAISLEAQCREFRGECEYLAAWVMLPQSGELMWPHGSSEQLQRLAKLREALHELDAMPTLHQIANLEETLGAAVDTILADASPGPPEPSAGVSDWCTRLRRAITECAGNARRRLSDLAALSSGCRELADLNFDFLYDPFRQLLTIGYNVADHRRDAGYYDLLASEARLASFIGIAQGKLPQEHWFSLGRMLTSSVGDAALLSWSGSMFEYLMPMLVMPSYQDTLLDQTAYGAVRRQIEYGRQRGVPWGFSESGYNTTDADFNYQYRAFGVPGMGLKRGLAEDVVVAPYATVMALMVAPEAASDNLRRLHRDGLLAGYGFYEAVDFTPTRIPRGQESVTIRSFMAHHQGMSLLALDYVLLDKPMQRRFESDPLFKATDLLLQERIPRAAPIFPHTAEVAAARRSASEEEPEGILRVFKTPDTPVPEVHLLSNGRYHVMVSAAGGSYSRHMDIAVTRWREDATRDCWGTFCYVRDTHTGEFWSIAYQPTPKSPGFYEAVFSQARAEFRRRDGEIDIHTEISVSPEDDVELRRISITNHGPLSRTIELTSYAEVVLATPAADTAHPAFSNLFVQTEIQRARQAILCTRRPRSATEKPPWMIHLLAPHDAAVGDASFETDRRVFLGRGRTVADPAALYAPTLSDTQGAVLDPIVSIRRAITVEPDQTVKIDLVTGIAETRETALALIEKYQDHRLADRVFNLAWTHSQIELRQLGATEAETQLFGRLAGSILYASPLHRASSSTIAQNRRGQAGLWAYAISGDLPIVLLRIGDISRMELVKQLVQAHAYWRMKGLATDLIIWNEDASGYRQTLHDEIMGVITSSSEAQLVDKPGGIFVRRVEQISEEDKVLMQTLARVIITDDGGTLAEQVERRRRVKPSVSRFVPVRTAEPPAPAEPPVQQLSFFNGVGGFTPDGREYVITTRTEKTTPAPWSNVIANPTFGTVVTESGGAYTWLENAHEARLTPWYNDSVSDTTGECLYIRDEETGRFWSPCPLPARGHSPYVTRHGLGYTIFEHNEDGIVSELTVFVPLDAPVKIFLLKIHNCSGRPRRLSLTAFVEWVLGEHRAKSLMHIITDRDQKTGALLAQNYYNPDFPERIAFLDSSEPQRTVTGNRTEFLGRNGSPANPAAMASVRLSGKVGAGLDPCGAMQTVVDLKDRQKRDVAFLLGVGRNLEDVRMLIKRFQTPGLADDALEVVRFGWNRTVETVNIETPEPAVDYLVNGWLPYQILSCRYWARSGFYQSGGAFGFRDQLQDVLALLYCEPPTIRAHLLRCAEHEFREGDVQHWWHPPQGRGVRTRISDDYIWLPYGVCRYVQSTGDTGVLDERVPFLEGRPVKSDEDSYYDLPTRSEETATLYEHCVRAIRNGLKFGEHGLPLMGCGDWNDGMNLVGEKGKGESVWLAFFLHVVLSQFSAVARGRGDAAFADECLSHAAQLKAKVEQNAWDGQWYRRAYFDDGTPLGSASNPECQIDALPQSWAALSGVGDPVRCKTALEAVVARLVRRDAGLIQLFDPPFNTSSLDPGYVRGYPPGVRENGGQYTHAAVWTVMAFAAIGDADRAWELFSLINPINHGGTPRAMQIYQVEPYVAAADVYNNPQHLGRGGWTWYTGSAGWMYRLLLESLLGVRLEVNHLRFEPVLPSSWRTYKIKYRYRESLHHITVHNQAGRAVTRVVLDGVDQPDQTVPLIDDHKDHYADVYIG